MYGQQGFTKSLSHFNVGADWDCPVFDGLYEFWDVIQTMRICLQFHPINEINYRKQYSLGCQVVKRFCKMFSERSPCLLGQHVSFSTAQGPVELSENILQNLFHNLTPQAVVLEQTCFHGIFGQFE